jgi:hypothetical protein
MEFGLYIELVCAHRSLRFSLRFPVDTNTRHLFCSSLYYLVSGIDTVHTPCGWAVVHTISGNGTLLITCIRFISSISLDLTRLQPTTVTVILACTAVTNDMLSYFTDFKPTHVSLLTLTSTSDQHSPPTYATSSITRTQSFTPNGDPQSSIRRRSLADNTGSTSPSDAERERSDATLLPSYYAYAPAVGRILLMMISDA